MSSSSARPSSSSKHPQQSKTVDVQHAQKLAQFAEMRSSCGETKLRIKQLEARIEELGARPRGDLVDDELEELLNAGDEVRDLRKKLDVARRSDEIDYTISTGAILYKYYEVLDNNARHVHHPGQSSSNNSILFYFAKNTSPSASLSSSPVKNGTGLASRPGENRADLLDQYMSATDARYVKAEPPAPPVDPTAVTTECPYCGSVDKTVRVSEGFAVCNACHALESILVDHDKPSYRELPQEISYFAYKRVNHFNEWLSQIQGKETTDIPDAVYDQILLELRKQMVTNMMDVTQQKIRDILKKLRCNKFYEHSAHILNRLNGKPIPHMPVELEDKLRGMFKAIQYPFLKHAPASRRNFLSYSFSLRKMLQLLGKDDFAARFPLLKSRDKLAQQDAIWRKICEELHWQFIPSL